MDTIGSDNKKYAFLFFSYCIWLIPHLAPLAPLATRKCNLLKCKSFCLFFHIVHHFKKECKSIPKCQPFEFSPLLFSSVSHPFSFTRISHISLKYQPIQILFDIMIGMLSRNSWVSHKKCLVFAFLPNILIFFSFFDFRDVWYQNTHFNDVLCIHKCSQPRAEHICFFLFKLENRKIGKFDAIKKRKIFLKRKYAKCAIKCADFCRQIFFYILVKRIKK